MKSRVWGAAVVALWLCFSAVAEAGRQDFTFRSERSFNAGTAATVTVHNWAGHVRVTGDGADSIRVIQDIVIPAADSAWAETFLEEVETTYDYTPEQLTINARILKSKRERLFMGGLMGLHDPGRGEVHYELRVPHTSHVNVVTHASSITVQTTSGHVRCYSRSGSVHLSLLQGHVRAYSATGVVEAEDCAVKDMKLGSESGAITITRSAGDIYLETRTGRIAASDIGGYCLITGYTAGIQVDGLRGHLRTRTTSGGVSAKVFGGSEIQARSGEVYLELQPEPGSESRIQTATGTIHLQLPGSTGVDLDVMTQSGALFDDLGVNWQPRTRREHTGRWAGGGALVQLETASGDIHLGGTP
jgi:DUF4097 and DUF4098 domain-containing protein YvlB